MRRKYSEQEKQELIRRYKESGKSAAQFGRENEISQINILRWIKKEESKSSNTGDANFVEIKKDNLMINSNENSFTSSIVLACNGCVLQIADGFNQATLKNILEVVKEL